MKLDNFNKHTAHYQLCSFINSPDYYNFDIKAEDLTILFIICRYLDMPDKKCFLKQINLAKECRLSRRFIQMRTDYLVSQKLLFRYLKRKLYHYELGEVITKIVQNKNDLI